MFFALPAVFVCQITNIDWLLLYCVIFLEILIRLRNLYGTYLAFLLSLELITHMTVSFPYLYLIPRILLSSCHSRDLSTHRALSVLRTNRGTFILSVTLYSLSLALILSVTVRTWVPTGLYLYFVPTETLSFSLSLSLSLALSVTLGTWVPTKLYGYLVPTEIVPYFVGYPQIW